MPLPLKEGYHFHFSHVYRPPCFEMTAAEAYTDFYGLSYTVRGDNLCYSPEGVAAFGEGDIFLIPKNVYFRSSYRSDAPREKILLKFTEDMIADLLAVMERESFDELLSGRELIIHLKKSEQKKVLQIMKEIEQEWNSYDSYSEIILKGLLNRLLILCFCKEKNTEKRLSISEKKKQDKLFQAIAYVKEHLACSPSLQETANHIHISPSYLSKIFVGRLYTPYSVFVLNEKILYAQKLLVNSNESMAKIAKKAGFSGNTYFSDCFKRVIGMSPLQFRQAYKNA